MNHDVTGLARFVNLDQERRELEERGEDLMLSFTPLPFSPSSVVLEIKIIVIMSK